MVHAFDAIRFDPSGLVPVVAQSHDDGRVLMLAYANREALERTIETKAAHYFSRSRAMLWRKGETSGHEQRVVEVRVDCDGDAIVYRVEQAGPACHTGAPECFFRVVEGDALRDAPLAPPRERVLSMLYDVVRARATSGGDRSYTRKLLEAGADAIGAKVREEADETARALADASDDEALVHEVADLWFHTVVALASRGVEPRRIFDELARRFGVSGIDEKESRTRR